MRLHLDLARQLDAEGEPLVGRCLDLELLFGLAVHVDLVGGVAVDAQLDLLPHRDVDSLADRSDLAVLSIVMSTTTTGCTLRPGAVARYAITRG